SPRSARMARTVPSASDEIVTWSTAARVPTTSTDRRTEFLTTRVVATGLALPSLPLGSPSARRPHATAASDSETRAVMTEDGFTVAADLISGRPSPARPLNRSPRPFDITDE